MTVTRTATGPHGIASATFSEDRAYRYALTRRWDDRPVVAFIMLNPSTADAAALDPTCRRVLAFARREGMGGFMVVNLFALRSTDPRGLRRVQDPVGPDNDTHLRAATYGAQYLVAAWGVHGALAGRDAEVKALLRKTGADVYRLGPPTQAGHPRHPLYLKGDAPLVRFL